MVELRSTGAAIKRPYNGGEPEHRNPVDTYAREQPPSHEWRRKPIALPVGTMLGG